MAEPFSFGIEEEYFLADTATKEVCGASDQFFTEVKEAVSGRVSSEFLRAQIEVITRPHVDMSDARVELRALRRIVSDVADRHGLAILASGTHPTAMWREQQQSEGARYDAVMDDLQMIGQRNMLCGLHVHVELPDPDKRVDVMFRMMPYLPLFLALATSSPFWQARRTGLMGYRLAAYDELPRTGVPELFRTKEEFDNYVEALVRAGIIPDSSYIWWAIRPSLAHPTLELRAPDSCTRLLDTIAIAALYRTLVHHVSEHPWLNFEATAVERAVVVENKWRAQRYGIHGTFATDGGAVTVPDFLERVIELTTASAATLGTEAELSHCRTIARKGTSADRQLEIYDAEGDGDNRTNALKAVTEWIAHETLQ